MRSGFTRLHPLVNLTFFVLVLAFAMFLSHPAVQLAGLVCAALFALRCTGRGFGRRMAMLLPLMLLAAVVNPLVSHQGVTVLFRFPSGNACTLESVLYGISAAVRLGTAVLWFMGWNAVMTSDKFVYLFGRILPSLSLTLSMGLRFVPRLLRRTRETADRLGVPAAALTFDTHPDTLVSGHSVPLLNTPEDRAALMREYYGIDEVLTLHFDRETMTQPWQRFAEETLLGRYHAVHLVCGHDFRFGDRGAGNPEKLAAFCAQRGIGFDRIDVIELDGAPVSSTRIRALLEAGDMAEAVRCLGHPHVLTGPVVSGRHLGRTIGIPTANLALPPQLLCPRHGVYAALACFDGRRLPAVVNIGSRPTVGGTHVTVEPWILDFDGDLYGRTLRLEFYTFLRPERKFDSLDELRAAILHNAEQTREFFRDR